MLQQNQEEVFDVFLSHDHGVAGENHVFVLKFAKFLQAKQLKVFIDSEKLRPGDDLAARLKNCLNHSNCVLMFITEQYRDKVNRQDAEDYCYLEFQHTLDHKPRNKIFTVVVEQALTSPTEWGPILGQIGNKMFINFSDIREFMAGVGSYCPFFSGIKFNNRCQEIYDAFYYTLRTSASANLNRIIIKLNEVASQYIEKLDCVFSNSEIQGRAVRLNRSIVELSSRFLKQIKIPQNFKDFDSWFNWIQSVFNMNSLELRTSNDFAYSCLSDPLKLMDHVSIVLCEVYSIVGMRKSDMNLASHVRDLYTAKEKCLFDMIQTDYPQTIICLLPDNGRSNYVHATEVFQNNVPPVGSLRKSCLETSSMLYPVHNEPAAVASPDEIFSILEYRKSTTDFHGKAQPQLAILYKRKLSRLTESLINCEFSLTNEFFELVSLWQLQCLSFVARMKLEDDYPSTNSLALQKLNQHLLFILSSEDKLLSLLTEWKTLLFFYS
jgi:hypothetical protein